MRAACAPVTFTPAIVVFASSPQSTCSGAQRQQQQRNLAQGATHRREDSVFCIAGLAPTMQSTAAAPNQRLGFGFVCRIKVGCQPKRMGLEGGAWSKSNSATDE